MNLNITPLSVIFTLLVIFIIIKAIRDTNKRAKENGISLLNVTLDTFLPWIIPLQKREYKKAFIFFSSQIIGLLLSYIVYKKIFN